MVQPSKLEMRVRFPSPTQICRYSTTVSASACHAEDVSSILITCSSFRLSTSDVKGMWLLRAGRNRLALTAL